MTGRWYLFIKEGNDLLRAGDNQGYSSLDEAQVEAKRHVDDALPSNKVWIMQLSDYAYCGGDGGSYLQSEG